MAACIDATTWAAAKKACEAARATVNGVGLGIWGKPRRTAVRGMGILGDLNPLNQLNVSTTAADDACGIAAQPVCPPTSHPLVGYCVTYPNDATCQPGGKTYCATYKTDPKCIKAPVVTDSLVPQPAATSTAGFSTVGLLAVLAVGGFVVYKVATHKKKAG